MTEVIMPKMGDAMEEGVLLEWLKKDGDKVKSGEVLGTIQTDKATLELESPGSGTLTGLLVKGGETVPVGKPIAAIVREGESLPEGWTNGAKVDAPASESVEATSRPSEQQDQAQEAAQPEPPAEGRIVASPLARKIAKERGIDLASIKGSGPGGRIIEKDIPEAAPATPSAPSSTPSAPPPEGDRPVDLNRLRQITAQRTAQSKQQVPHFYVTVEVDVERLMALRQMFEEDESGKVSVNDFVVRACALALREMPQVNSSYEGQKLSQHGEVNIGMAVALDDGLTLPVIKRADQMTLRQISATAKDLAGKARENKLHPDELAGATFSISNMGMLDIDNFIAIIVQPNAGILAVSSIRKRVVVSEEGDEFEVRQKMNVSASFDHRVVDGAVGARFINLVKAYLENPSRLVS